MENKNLRIDRNDAIFVAIDFQERLMPVMSDVEKLRDKIRRITRGMGVLKIPAIATEQYPRGLGETENKEAFKEALGKVEIFEKDTFSAFGSKEFCDALEKSGRKTVILCGIETHICVQQTAMDLLERGYKVHLLADCCSSRSAEDKAVAMWRMQTMGVSFVTVETVLFELMAGNKDPEFKAISKIIK